MEKMHPGHWELFPQERTLKTEDSVHISRKYNFQQSQLFLWDNIKVLVF